MSIPASTAKYLELSSRTYELILDTLASATRSRLDYWKSIWEIVSRPYPSTAIAATIQENLDRTRELTDLTVNEVHSRSQRAIDFSKKWLAQVEHQNAALETHRDSWSSIGSTMGQVGVAAKELSVDGGSTVDQSSNGRKMPANPVSVSN